MTHGGPRGWNPPPLPEISVRGDAALLLRALHGLGYDDVLAGHITVALGDGTMLANPFELAWDEIRASDLVVIGMDGSRVAGDYNVNPAIELHTALRRSRPDVVVAIHNHPRWANIWAAARRIPPVYDQTSAQVAAELALVDEYGGQFNAGGASEAAVKLFGDAEWAILANHGVLITAPTIAEAFIRAYTLEWRARRAFEVEALGGGTALPPEVVNAFGSRFPQVAGPLWWEAERRRQFKRDPQVLN